MAAPFQTIDPGATQTNQVYVFNDDQFKQLLATITPGPGLGAKVETVAKQSAEEVVANFKALVTDVENTLGHVHGAAKQLQLDVKSNWIMIALGAVTVMNTVLILKPLFHF